MTTTSSTIDLTDTKATADSHTSSVENDTYDAANAKPAGTNSMFLTASEGIFRGQSLRQQHSQERRFEWRLVHAGH